MSTVLPAAISIPLKKQLLNNKARVEVTLDAPTRPQLRASLAANRPPDDDVQLGVIRAAAEVDSGAIEFAAKGGSVRFRAEAAANAGLGIFLRGERLPRGVGLRRGDGRIAPP